MAASSTWTLKVEFEGEVRRLRGWPENAAEPTLASLSAAASALFGFSHSDAGPLSVRYRDDKGDLCTLSEVTLPDALSLAAAPPRILRLVLTRGPPAVATKAEPEQPQEPLAAGVSSTSPSSLASYCLVEAVDAVATFEASVEGASPAAAEALAAATDATAADDATTADGPPAADGGAAAAGGATVCDSAAADGGATAAGSAAAADGATAAGDATNGRDAHSAAETSAAATRRRRLSEGLAHFGRQVAGDFHAACEDTKDAFRPKGCPAAREDRSRLADKVSTVPAAVVGAVVAARMAPVHVLRLAAHSAAAVAGKDVPTDLEAVGAPTDTCGEPAGREAEATAAEGRAGAQACIAKEVQHFAKQVTQDFHSVRADVKAAFGYIVSDPSAPTEPPTAAGQDSVALPEPTPTQAPLLCAEGQQHPRPWSARLAVPALASTIAGVTVAGTLIPVRALRLAVAGTAAAASAAAPARDDAEAAPAPAAAEPPAAEERAAAPEPIPAVAPAAAADEELARRLQAEEEAAATAAPTQPVLRGQVDEDESLARRLQAEEDAAASTAMAAAP